MAKGPFWRSKASDKESESTESGEETEGRSDEEDEALYSNGPEVKVLNKEAIDIKDRNFYFMRTYISEINLEKPMKFLSSETDIILKHLTLKGFTM